MPATFAHCLLAREAMERLGKTSLFPGVLKGKPKIGVRLNY